MVKPNKFFEVAPPYRGVNRLAVSVIKQAHIDDTFHKDNPELGRSESREPFPNRLPTRFELNNGMPNFSGMKFGRSTVLGVQIGRTAKKLRWVLRCSCGTYMLRTTKALRATTNIESFACYDCVALARLKRHEYVRRTGKEADAEDFL